MVTTYQRAILALTVVVTAGVTVSAQRPRSAREPNGQALLKIIRYEDQRKWNDDLKNLLSHSDASVRKRAALAAGRIGVEGAVPVLAEMLLGDGDPAVREIAAFALGEIESAGGAYALVTVLKDVNKPGRAQAIEALGKIIAALSAARPASSNQAAGSVPDNDDRLDILKAEIFNALRFEDNRRAQADRQVILLGLTAVLRARPDAAGPIVTKFLDYSDPRIVADALNTMARLRLKDGNERVRQLLNHSDPIVRANAARVIGAAEHKEALDDLLARALNDSDLRVRVSAIRSLATLRDARAAEPLLKRGGQLLSEFRAKKLASSNPQNELLEIAAAIGRVNPLSTDVRYQTAFLSNLREMIYPWAPETEVAYARVSPTTYVGSVTGVLSRNTRGTEKERTRQLASVAQGLTEVAAFKTNNAAPREQALSKLSHALCKNGKNSCAPTLALPALMRAYAAFKPNDLEEVVLKHLSSDDVVVRATAAELLGEQAPSDANTRALVAALPRALKDTDLDDAALAILGALGKQKNPAANDAIKTALDSSNHLIRRRAVALLKANGAGDFSGKIGAVQTRNTNADYRRAIARIGKRVTATVVTARGSFTIEFLPEDAPLTVDNFVQLAKRGYFNGQIIPRVVPNFVIQAGDPRGDQNGGPGYSIRCEINQIPYERAAVGMALSGKDTGGSQWFVTHSPQPHLDGGYTVFGRVVRGMDVVDNIVRGDVIRRVVVNER
jgi:cyclophilin family peptidyl-prolyl cis-trans isomerase